VHADVDLSYEIVPIEAHPSLKAQPRLKFNDSPR
jgi:hypothetical protein